MGKVKNKGGGTKKKKQKNREANKKEKKAEKQNGIRIQGITIIQKVIKSSREERAQFNK